MKYVITGAGQIGAQLAIDLVAAGHEVVVVRRGNTPLPGTQTRSGDVADPALLDDVLTGAAAVFHCIHAAYSAQAWERELPGREAAVMDAAVRAGIPVVFPESVYAFGTGAQELHEGAPLTPASPLGEVRAKLLRARAAHAATTLSVVASDLLGPTATMSGSVILSMVIKPAVAGKRAFVLGKPSYPHAITSIPDLSRGMIAAAQNAGQLAPGGDAVLLAPTPPAISQLAVAQQAAKLAEAKPGKATGIPFRVLRVVGLFSPPMREIAHQAYLWDAPSVLYPGRLSTELGIGFTPWAVTLGEAVRGQEAARN